MILMPVFFFWAVKKKSEIFTTILTVRVNGDAWVNSTVIRQKGKSQNGRYKKIKHTKFSVKRTFLRPDTHTYVCV